MDDLKAQAAELGIKIDGRWSEERLREEIDKALGGPVGGSNEHGIGPDTDGGPNLNYAPEDTPAGPAPERLIPVKIERDFWDAEGTRHRKGAIVEVSVEAALDGVESGALSRVK